MKKEKKKLKSKLIGKEREGILKAEEMNTIRRDGKIEEKNEKIRGKERVEKGKGKRKGR